jgi:serine phosphatase RsbU (regulator of sigma subunit)/anti-sigma regulatory factor (Ser/Thr protein kinase)
LVLSRWRQFRARIITWSFVPTVAILAAVAVLTFLSYEDVVQGEIEGRNRERTYQAASRLREEVLKLSENLASLARTLAIYEDYLVGQRSAMQNARTRLAAFDGGVVLLDSRGQVIGAEPARPEIFRQDWSDRLFFRRLLSGETVVVSDAIAEGVGGSQVVVVAVPVTSHRGDFLGALAGMFRLGEPTISSFYASVVRLRIGEAGNAILVDSNGRVIYHPQPEEIGRQFREHEVLDRVLAGQIDAFRDGDRVVGFAPVPGTPWSLITVDDWESLTSTSRSYERFLLGLLILGIILPAVGFGFLARERRREALDRARIEQQMRVARVIQQTLLPKSTPNLAGWQVTGHYQPAQAVGGDFYDYLHLDDGRLGLLIGDVTDKGVPAALVMATTRSLLRSAARSCGSPGQVLQQVNEQLVREIPPKMFVTCLYAILDPRTGRLRFANAGHNLPYRTGNGNGQGAVELQARGMPLGLMSGMVYDEAETTIEPGECLVFYSDGLVEAHNPQREMFGNPRLRSLLSSSAGQCPALIERLLSELERFTGRGWQQEDDVTLLTLHRGTPVSCGPEVDAGSQAAGVWQVLGHFSLPSEPGGERRAIEDVARAVGELGLSSRQLDRLKTAVGEATMNAMEHGHHYRPELAVEIEVLSSSGAVAVRITDQGSGPSGVEPEVPDIEAKVAGLQSPRGWGTFLIGKMVDCVNVVQDETGHTLELILLRRQTGGQDAGTEP